MTKPRLSIHDPDFFNKATSDESYDLFKQGWLKAHPNASEEEIDSEFGKYIAMHGQTIAKEQQNLNARYSEYVNTFLQLRAKGQIDANEQRMSFDEYAQQAKDVA